MKNEDLLIIFSIIILSQYFFFFTLNFGILYSVLINSPFFLPFLLLIACYLWLFPTFSCQLIPTLAATLSHFDSPICSEIIALCPYSFVMYNLSMWKSLVQINYYPHQCELRWYIHTGKAPTTNPVRKRLGEL